MKLPLYMFLTTAAVSAFTMVPSLHRLHITRLSNPGLYSSPKEDEESWDENVDYDKVWKSDAQENAMPNSEWDDVKAKNVNLDIPNVSELMDAETAAELKEEAKQILDRNFQEGLDQLAKMRVELNKDIESQKRVTERKSAARNAQAETRLMSKIDGLAATFLKDSEEMRESTKLAAAADAAMEGRGVDLGSWGVVDGAEVTTGDTAAAGLLGSVDSAKRQQEVALSPSESRILIVADESSDPVAKQLIPKFTKALQDIMSVDIQVLKPTQQMPLGGNNAACVVFFLTSLSSPPRALIERLLRKTMGAGGTMGRPPTQLVAISTVGTERTDKFPYSMQNIMGRKLENRRDMEESLVTVVKERAVLPPLDYTILKFGELKESKDDFSFLPGDVLDGTTSSDLAAQVLVQAVAFQPAARNTTLCSTGNLPADMDNSVWDDIFLKLKGPELARYESLDIPADKFVQLREYLKEWGKVLADSGKLTTPVDCAKSTQGPNAAFEGVAQRGGMKLLFRATSTGQDYLSKEEEREMESKGIKPSSNRRVKPEGGVEVLVEVTTKGALRVRATRTDMGPATVVKELSEATILKRLEDSLDLFVRDFAYDSPS